MSNCDPCCPLIGFDSSQTTMMTTPTALTTDDCLDADTAPADDDDLVAQGHQQTEQTANEPEEREDSGGLPTGGSACYYCSGRMARVNDYCENGNFQQGDDVTNDDDDGASATDPPATTDPTDVDGENANTAEDGLVSNGNGTALSTENGDDGGGEDGEMTPPPMCATCEANARNARGCVIRHLKSVGKCFRSGLLNFCAVALALNDQGYRAVGIRIDSGDLAYLSCLARETFERISEQFKLPWFSKLTIVASNDINEETILSLNEQGHKIDCFGIGTHLVTCQRQPALGCVYKMVEINAQPRIKLSQDVVKVTMPGNKNVFRLYGADGHALIDLLQRVDESPPEVGQKVLCRHPFQESKRAYVIPTHVEPLYDVYWTDGRVTQAMPSLEEVRDRVQNSLRTLRQDHKRTLNPTPYKVAVSDNLYNFIHDLWLQNAPIGELS